MAKLMFYLSFARRNPDVCQPKSMREPEKNISHQRCQMTLKVLGQLAANISKVLVLPAELFLRVSKMLGTAPPRFREGYIAHSGKYTNSLFGSQTIKGLSQLGADYTKRSGPKKRHALFGGWLHAKRRRPKKKEMGGPSWFSRPPCRNPRARSSQCRVGSPDAARCKRQ